MWWNTPEYDGTVAMALGHVNQARSSPTGPAVDRCDLYFMALNQLWNGLGHLKGLQHSDTPRFVALCQSLSTVRGSALLQSSEVASVLSLEPLVMNHHRLNEHGYRPGAAISPELSKKATEEHVALKKRVSTWRSTRSGLERVLKSLAEFLYVVRSNIAHGEKTPHGPDREKARRDEQVAAAVLPVQELLLDEILDRPSERLVAYGSLKPGEANANVLAGVGGEWQECTIRGRVEVSAAQFPEFSWDPNGDNIAAMVLNSPELKNEWRRIDRFEGVRYQRHLVPVLLASGRSVANCYVHV